MIITRYDNYVCCWIDMQNCSWRGIPLLLIDRRQALDLFFHAIILVGNGVGKLCIRDRPYHILSVVPLVVPEVHNDNDNTENDCCVLIDFSEKELKTKHFPVLSCINLQNACFWSPLNRVEISRCGTWIDMAHN